MADHVENEELPQEQQSVQEGNGYEEPPRKRYKITSEEEENAWNLLLEMMDYVTEQFENYTKEKDIKESVLAVNPVPSNMTKVRRLDMYLSNERRKEKVGIGFRVHF